MIGARRLGRQQHKDKVDRFIVDGIEVYGRIEMDKQTKQLIQIGQPAMRYCDSLADTGCPETLAPENRLEYLPRIQARKIGGPVSKIP